MAYQFLDDLCVSPISNEFYILETHAKSYVYDCARGRLAALPSSPLPGRSRLLEMCLAQTPREHADQVFTPEGFLSENKLARLMLFLTDACNLRCVYCHCESGGTCRVENHAFAAADKYLDIALALPTRPESLQVTFMGGGEPLLCFPQIQRVVHRMEQRCAPAGVRPEFVLVTNATLADERMWKWLSERRFRITISADGPPHIQDAQRSYADGRGTSSAIARALMSLDKLGCKVHIRSTVVNVAAVRDICEYFEQFPAVDTHSLEPVSFAGRGAALLKGTPFPPESFYPTFFAAYSRFLYADPGRYKSAWFKPFKRMDGFCGATYYNAVVTHDGYVTVCTEVDSFALGTDLGQKFIVGKLGVDANPFLTPRSRQFSRLNSITRLPQCRECVIRYKCGGGCYVKREREFASAPDRFAAALCQPVKKLNLSYLIGAYENENRLHAGGR